MAEDKTTIGVTEAADRVLVRMVEKGHFKQGIDAAKFAMAVAINAGARKNDESLTVEGANTKWNVGSFDSDGQLRSLIAALHPDIDQPYRMLESLIDDGLRHVGKRMASSGDALDIIGLLDEAGTDPNATAP